MEKCFLQIDEILAKALILVIIVSVWLRAQNLSYQVLKKAQILKALVRTANVLPSKNYMNSLCLTWDPKMHVILINLLSLINFSI